MKLKSIEKASNNKKTVLRECTKCNFQIITNRKDPLLSSIRNIREGIIKHDRSRNHGFTRLNKNFTRVENREKTKLKIFEFIKNNPGMSASPSQVRDGAKVNYVNNGTIAAHIRSLIKTGEIQEVKGRYYV